MTRLPLALLLLAAWAPAQAAINCTVTTSGFTAVYDTVVNLPNDSQGSYTVSCSRSDLSNDPTSLSYTLTANDGVNVTGGRNHAVNGNGAANRVEYELYTSPSYSIAWSTTPATSISGTVNFGSTATANASDTRTFYARIPQRQTVNAKTFSDTVTLTLCSSTGTCTGAPYGVTGGLSVTVITTPSCQVSTPPSDLNFTYSSFQAGPSGASTTYAVRCTGGVTYSSGLDATSGTLLGLNYTLSLSNTSTVTGTGVPQSYSISGSIAGGQSGTCNAATCTAAQRRTLTITY
jgi:spore coat protein U-like protein